MLELLGRQIPAAIKTGAHIGPDKARTDFAWGENLALLLPSITNSADAIVAVDFSTSPSFGLLASPERRRARRPGGAGPVRSARQLCIRLLS